MMIDISAFVPAAVILTAMFLPVWLAIAVVLYQKRTEARDERRSPLKDKLLHQPGAQARRKAEEAGDEIMARTSFLFLVGPLAIVALLLPHVQWATIQLRWVDWIVIAGVLIGITWCIRDIVRYRHERRNWLNGMRGEMASAQSLDRLRAHGCEVFHDLPGERGNIDHVVVATNAVFAIETKWRSKRGTGSGSAEVWFDGKALQFPGGFHDARPVEQANACAADLAKYLAGRTGERVQVIPVVALPGWFTKDRPEAAHSKTIVINPKMVTRLTKQPAPDIPTPQRNRIIHAIAEGYPEPEA